MNITLAYQKACEAKKNDSKAIVWMTENMGGDFEVYSSKNRGPRNRAIKGGRSVYEYVGNKFYKITLCID